MLSFLLHIVLLLAVYYLYQQLQLTKQHQEKQLETVLADFLDELKRENERLQSQLEKNTSDYTQNVPVQTDPVYNVEENEKNWPVNNVDDSDKKDQVETSLESQILQLNHQGFSIEEIAKQLNRGKTEVELIVKLHHSRVVNT